PRLFQNANGVLGLSARLPLALEQAAAFLFRALAVRRIDVRARHAVGLAGGVALRHAARQHPAVGSIPMAKTILVFVVGRRAVDMGLVDGEYLFALIGMEPRLPFLERIADFVVLIAEDLFPARRIINLTGDQVPVP